MNERGRGFSSVLLSDTAKLLSGFPLLVHDPVFLPALIDLFKERKLVTVCIGVDTEQPRTNAGINFTLSSRADYRIVMSHYPEKSALYKDIVDHRDIVRQGQRTTDVEKIEPLQEQLVSLVIDNVSGKHYGREPRWLRVIPKKEGKVLLCETEPHIGNHILLMS
jgi:hypothetical protein